MNHLKIRIFATIIILIATIIGITLIPFPFNALSGCILGFVIWVWLPWEAIFD